MPKTCPGVQLAAVAVLLLHLLTGCITHATTSADGSDTQNEKSVLHVDDPLEGWNRQVYWFNAKADRYVLLPIIDTYTFVVPLPIRDRISDFFANIGDLITFANLILQLKFPEAGQTAMRIGANSLLGMFGLVDIATPMGLPRYQEDFGQTLGFWGTGGGPYLVLPILGPSNVRDTVGLATDTVAFAIIDPFGASSIQTEYPAIIAVDAVNARYIQSFRYFESGSPFEYDLVRFLYTKKRQVQIGDLGAPGDAQPSGALGAIYP